MPNRNDPFARFAEIYLAAVATGIKNPNAMTLATASADGAPSARQVLLKHFDADGFVFYTNLESRKGRQLEVNPNVALNFYWREIDRQVIVEGRATPVSTAEADAYFASRDRGSQVGAWASRQSTPLPSREALEDRVRHVEARFAGQPVPRPPFWGGYRLNPQRIEFWQGKESRLHDRLLYERDGDGWVTTRLAP